MNFGSAGIGSAGHLSGELLKMMIKGNISTSPTRAAARDVRPVGRQRALGIRQRPHRGAQVQAGKIRALAVTGPKRFANLADVRPSPNRATRYSRPTGMPSSRRPRPRARSS